MGGRYSKQIFYKMVNQPDGTKKVEIDVEATTKAREEQRLSFVKKDKRGSVSRASNNSKYYEEKNKREIQAFLKNELDGSYSNKSKKSRIREKFVEALWEEANFSCILCGYSKLKIDAKTGKKSPNLHIDHINGRDIPRAGFKENLQVICPNCHGEKDDRRNYK
tara:strand:+ start:375 stop:866 length:492 start_codon:yes stop_codon:yes gene_type:complete